MNNNQYIEARRRYYLNTNRTNEFLNETLARLSKAEEKLQNIDFTPEEALAEAKKRWGDGADIKIMVASDGRLLRLVYGYMNINGENFKGLRGTGETFRDAFVQADAKIENPELLK